MTEWQRFKERCKLRDRCPFMAWERGRQVIKASWDPSSDCNFWEWLDKQIRKAILTRATFISYVTPKGTSHGEKIA